jgi:hypothetical protein
VELKRRGEKENRLVETGKIAEELAALVKAELGTPTEGSPLKGD